MKTICTYLLLLTSTVLLFNCKKYPEGGYHFNAIKHLEGTWKLKLYKVNGIDSTNLTQGANDIPSYFDKFAVFAVAHSGKRAQINLKNHYHGYDVSINNKKRELIGVKGTSSNFDSSGCLLYDSQMCQRNIFIPTNETSFIWKIEKLTKKELILVSNIYDYKLVLVK